VRGEPGDVPGRPPPLHAGGLAEVLRADDGPVHRGGHVRRRRRLTDQVTCRESNRGDEFTWPLRASDDDSSRWTLARASNSLAFFSNVPTASAPADQRSGGSAWPASWMSALASLAGSLRPIVSRLQRVTPGRDYPAGRSDARTAAGRTAGSRRSGDRTRHANGKAAGQARGSRRQLTDPSPGPFRFDPHRIGHRLRSDRGCQVHSH
jgi:hypothetical protein